MGKPSLSTSLRVIWAVVLIGFAVWLLSDSGKMLSTVYRHGTWFGVLLVLYLLASTAIHAVGAVQRAARDPIEPENKVEADQLPDQPVSN